MSEIKEPSFFSDDIDINPGGITSLDKYEQLFSPAGSNHIAVGEASTQYLYSDSAVENILGYNPEAKFIVMLRNPIKMAHSLHFQQVYSLNEEVEDFKTAWYLQEERKRGNKVPSACNDPQVLQYGDWCKTGQQMKRLMQNVEEDQVFTILLDDMKDNPRKVYEEVLRFLNVPDDRRKQFPKHNTSTKVRLKFLERVIRKLGKVKRAIGINKPLKVSRMLNNTKEQKREPLSDKMKSELLNYFRHDIHLLEETINRDLSEWTDVETHDEAAPQPAGEVEQHYL